MNADNYEAINVLNISKGFTREGLQHTSHFADSALSSTEKRQAAPIPLPRVDPGWFALPSAVRYAYTNLVIGGSKRICMKNCKEFRFFGSYI